MSVYVNLRVTTLQILVWNNRVLTKLCVAQSTDHGENSAGNPNDQRQPDWPGGGQDSLRGNEDPGPDYDANDHGDAVEQSDLLLQRDPLARRARSSSRRCRPDRRRPADRVLVDRRSAQVVPSTRRRHSAVTPEVVRHCARAAWVAVAYLERRRRHVGGQRHFPRLEDRRWGRRRRDSPRHELLTWRHSHIKRLHLFTFALNISS